MANRLLTATAILGLCLLSTACKVADDSDYVVAATDNSVVLELDDVAQNEGKLERQAEEKPRSPQQELAYIQSLFDRAEQRVKSELSGYGRGWLGNVSRTGPHCDKVFYAFERELRRIAPNSKFHHYLPVQLFSAGSLPLDIGAHIYMGVARKANGRPSESDLVYIYDPWRWGDVKPRSPRNNPNRVDQINVFNF